MKGNAPRFLSLAGWCNFQMRQIVKNPAYFLRYRTGVTLYRAVCDPFLTSWIVPSENRCVSGVPDSIPSL